MPEAERMDRVSGICKGQEEHPTQHGRAVGHVQAAARVWEASFREGYAHPLREGVGTPGCRCAPGSATRSRRGADPDAKEKDTDNGTDADRTSSDAKEEDTDKDTDTVTETFSSDAQPRRNGTNQPTTVAKNEAAHPGDTS